MKYIRRKIVRDVVDAIKNETNDTYFVKMQDGTVDSIPTHEFEAQYEPLLRERKTKQSKPAKVRKEKRVSDTSTSTASAQVVPS